MGEEESNDSCFTPKSALLGDEMRRRMNGAGMRGEGEQLVKFMIKIVEIIERRFENHKIRGWIVSQRYQADVILDLFLKMKSLGVDCRRPADIRRKIINQLQGSYGIELSLYLVSWQYVHLYLRWIGNEFRNYDLRPKWQRFEPIFQSMLLAAPSF
jgi:hypothetical protein